jgi:hypothetical protein
MLNKWFGAKGVVLLAFSAFICSSFGAAASLDLASAVIAIGNPKPPAATPHVTQPPASTAAGSGEAAIADNFDIATALKPTDYPNPQTGLMTGGLPEASNEGGAFRIACRPGQLLRDDPLLMPGQAGAAHLHQFWGNMGANANSTTQSLRTSGQSTCTNPNAGPANRTAYWMPAMLDGVGNAVKPDLISTYYKQHPASDPVCKESGGACVGLPNGLRYVFGYNMTTGKSGITDPNAPESSMLRYACFNADGSWGVKGHFQSIDAVVAAGCPAGAKLHVDFVAPDCWDGKNVDSADHRSHLVYPTRATPTGARCPLTHPYWIPNWGGFVVFTTDANFVAGKWRLSSDDHASHMSGQRVPAGSTLHFDYWEAWSPTVKAAWQQHCINGAKSCSNGDLGNGTMVNHDDLGPWPTHQLVPAFR